MQLTGEHLSPLRRTVSPAILLIILFTTGCADDDRLCERCDFVFYWNSDLELSGSEEECREIHCRDALCEVCYEIDYNEWGLPASGTCDSCDNYEPDCGSDRDRIYCPMHPDECAAAGVPLEACGCVDTETDDLHCGGCYNACTDGRQCVDGECQ